MAYAFEEAKKALGHTSPNPLVGCVIVKNGKIIAKGHHKKSGFDHAELDAIKNATESVEGGTLYCNLEPCCHLNKKTPPCAQRLIQEKIKKVVIANLDPNPEVAGGGVKLLREAGIEVITGVMQKEGEKLNEIFFTHILLKRPFITLKMAQTLDAKLATSTNESKWITGDASREHVHLERKKYDAILVGANTLRVDNPSLTVRTQNETMIKKRIVLSKSALFTKGLKLFEDEFKEHTLLVLPTNIKSHLDIPTLFIDLDNEGNFDLNMLLKELYLKGITSLYVEGGPFVHTRFLKERLFDRLDIYIAPKILGSGLPSFGDLGISSLQDAITFDNKEFISLGEDFLFTAKRKKD